MDFTFLHVFYVLIQTAQTVYVGNLGGFSASWLRSKLECVACTLTFDLGCERCPGICSAVNLCRFCVLSLHREVGGVRQYTRFKIARSKCSGSKLDVVAPKEELITYVHNSIRFGVWALRLNMVIRLSCTTATNGPYFC